MSEIKCFDCAEPDAKTKYMGRYFCEKCFKELCHFCSDRDGVPVGKRYCSGHSFSSSTRNRFMEDQTFVKGGGFDLESE